MKKVILAVLSLSVFASSVQASTVQRFVGTSEVYDSWTGDHYRSCYVAVKQNASAYEVTISYDRKELKGLEKTKFVLNKKDIVHLATSSAHAEDPVNYKQDEYFVRTELKGSIYLGMSLRKTSSGFQIDRANGFYFRKPRNANGYPYPMDSYPCMDLRPLSNY